MLDEEIGEEEDVGAAILELRHVDGKLVDAVVEVLAKLSVGHQAGQVAIGGAHQSNVDVYLVGATQWAHLALLQGAQQLHLHIIRQVAHLIEKQRAAVGLHEGARLVGGGPGEGALHVSEKLRCRHLLGNGATVEREERLVAARTQFVDAARHILLARAAGAQDEHRHGCGRHKAHIFVELARRLALAFYVARHVGRGLLGLDFGRRRGGLRRGRWLRCAEGVANLLQQDVGLYRFGNIVAGAGLHGQHRILHLGVARHHDERYAQVVFPHPFEQKQTVVVGQAKVGKDEVEVGRVGQLARGGADRAHPVDIKSLLAQPGLHHGGKGEVVFYDKDVWHGVI